MSIARLAFRNFKSSLRHYLALILSLSFTILVFLNFQYLVYSDALDVIGAQNKEYSDMLLQTVSVVLGCFMFFFLWYATNVFLVRRKREIGIYVFMGLTNKRIGKLYAFECALIGGFALVLGIVLGMLVAQLFLMILLAVSDISVDIHVHFVLKPVLITAGVYLIMYLIFVIKGYVSIVRSSVLDMINVNRKNETVRQRSWVLVIKSLLGVAITAAGFFYAVKEGGQEVLNNILLAVVLVIIGIYFLFGGVIPLIFQSLERNKRFLYKRQRTLWINSMVFRMKKNYRTYAIVSILMLCSVTALATGFAMKQRYDKIVHFRNTYTYQILSDQRGLYDKARTLIEKDSDIRYGSQVRMLTLSASHVKTRYKEDGYVFLPYSEVKRIARDAHLPLQYKEPKDDEIISLDSVYLLSLITKDEKNTVTIDGTKYRETAGTDTPYLGTLQGELDCYVLNDAQYARYVPLGQETYNYNYKIKGTKSYQASRHALDQIVSNTAANHTSRIAVDPGSSDIEWIKVFYSVCIFLFMVFIFAGSSVLFMRIYNDAYDERERYTVLKKIGFGQTTLKKAIASEMRTAYALPFLVMAVASYFSVHALAKMMFTSLLVINGISVAVIFVFFLLTYLLSVALYRKNTGVA